MSFFDIIREKKRCLMDTKICKKCNVEKSLAEFARHIVNGKVYFTGKCKECINEEKRERYKNNEEIREKARENAKRYGKLHREEIKEKRRDYLIGYRKKYYQDNKEYFQNYKKSERYKEQQRQYRAENEEYIKEQRKKYKKENHDIILEKRKKWDKKYRDNHKEERKQWIQDNVELIRKERRDYHHKRAGEDALYRFEKQIRGLIISSFRRKSLKKSSHTYDIVGLEFDELYDYLLKTFKDNYGYDWDGIEEVHIDHIIPLSTADTEEDIIRLCYYTNLQLLKAKDNLNKKDKLDWSI